MNCFAQWHLANQAASQAEDAIAEASLRAAMKGGPASAPSEEAIANARYLRAIANERFEVAMNEISAITRSRPAPLRA